ncbi:Hypothetical Protein RRSL_03472 [Ralstonia solanacearum UW551]|uniref:Uncharacterized protein n=1 Tax=Ralstonia solanacearum (strain UW551) TaxID=342110 RepID=A0AB33VGI4_RALSU|nr:Hypothetical Protein RRSL_03472 [Ralstonia solanacearum UW551]
MARRAQRQHAHAHRTDSGDGRCDDRMRLGSHRQHHQ